MSARRSSQPSVQLFPFLAVLMCALGALILMLLVTTARIRDQARARAAHARTTVAETTVKPPAITRPKVPARAEWKPVASPPAVWLKPIEKPVEPVLPAPPRESLREQWQRTVADLEASAAAKEAALRAQRAVAESEEAALQTASTQLTSLQRDVEQLARKRGDAENALLRAQQRESELRRSIVEQELELKELQAGLESASSRFSIVPYDGRTGTVRRPIYIECTETGLTFASEGITVTPGQLDGFPSLHNPLRAGAEALIDYWSLAALRGDTGSNAGAPYVLLVVRPGGTVAYYVARRMLEALGDRFGYELVPEDLELQWPESDDGAVAACQAAIDAVLLSRNRFALSDGPMVPPSLSPLSVSDGRGRFALEEVENLRSSGRKVHFGGRAFDRDAAGAPPPEQRGGSEAAETAPLGHSGRRPKVAEFGVPSSQRELSSKAGGDSTPRPLPSADDQFPGGRQRAGGAPRNPTEVLHDPGSRIGLERKVIVRVTPQQVVVESRPAISVSAGMSREELQAELAQELQSMFVDWGPAPRGFYWLPRVKYSVTPGGQQHIKRLTDLTDEWQIKSVTDYVFE